MKQDVPAGVIPPLVTPFTAEREVDTQSLARLVNRMIEAGAVGLFPLGSSGEVSFLSSKQRREVLETVVSTAAGRVPVLAGMIDMSRNRVLDNARVAAEAGADFAVVTAPFYAKVNERDIETHFRSVAAASPIPIVAYDIPVNVGHKLDADMLVRLGMEGVIKAVKDSSGVGYGLRLLAMKNAEAGHPLTILTGTEVLADSDILIGADGIVPGLANVAPEEYVRLFDLASTGQWDQARALQERLVRLFQIIDCDTSTTGPAQAIGAFKEAMKLRGIIEFEYTAEPSFPLTEQARRDIGVIVNQFEQEK